MKKELRIKVYEKYDGHCAYCGKEIAYEDMQVDHQQPKRHGGKDTIDNLFPACRRCNHYKRDMNLETFRIYITTLHERVSTPYINKVAIDYGILKVIPFLGMFYFEKIDKNIQQRSADRRSCVHCGNTERFETWTELEYNDGSAEPHTAGNYLVNVEYVKCLDCGEVL